MNRSTKIAIGVGGIVMSGRGGHRVDTRCRAGSAACVQVLTVPQLEEDESPEPQGVVAAPGDVLANHAIHERRIEVSAFASRLRSKDIGEKLAEVAAKPAADRYGEALFPPIENLWREQSRRSFLEDVLLPSVLYLETSGNGSSEINDA